MQKTCSLGLEKALNSANRIYHSEGTLEDKNVERNVGSGG